MTSCCPQGHSLRMSVMTTDWNCDSCNHGFPAGQKSYGCRVCNYDSCESCVAAKQHQPQQQGYASSYRDTTAPVPTFRPDATKCPKGHGLNKSNFEPQQRWQCDKCCQVKIGGASYSCRIDNYDQCETCSLFPAPANNETAPSQQTKAAAPSTNVAKPTASSFITTCDQGHDLIISQMPQNQRWQCDYCPNIQTGGTSWADRKCNIDMCDGCYADQTKKQEEKKAKQEQKKQEQQQASPPAAPTSKISNLSIEDQKLASAKCPAGHKLVRSEFKPDLEWKCDHCMETRKGGSAFSCRADNYDQCIHCTRDDFKVPCWLCLQRLVRQDVPNIEWKCDKCMKMFRGGASYGCRSCDRDACSACFAELEKKRISALDQISIQQQVQNQQLASIETKKQEQEDIANQNKLHQQINASLAQILSAQQNNNNNNSNTSSMTATSSSSATAKCPSCKKTLTKSTLTIEWKCDKCGQLTKGGSAYSCRDDNYDQCEKCTANASTTNNYTTSATTTSTSSTTALTPTTNAFPATEKYRGRCKALLIGINYPGTRSELHGCVDDVALIRKVLPIFGFELNSTNCKILVDDPTFPGRAGEPTKQGIISGVEWLVSGAKPGDNLFMHVSSHGGQIPDDDADEDDGFDEALIPSDYESAGVIRDDWLFAHLVKPLPAGCNLRIIFDCCNSSSLVESEFTWVFAGEQKKFVPYQSKGKSRGFISASKKHAECNCWVISGTTDNSTSADITSTADYDVDLLVGKGPGKAGGACTTSLVEVLARAPRNAEGLPSLTMAELFFQLQESLRRRRFQQQPQLSASKKFDLMTTPFSFVGPMMTDGGASLSGSNNNINSNPYLNNVAVLPVVAPLAIKQKPKFKALFVGINYTGTSAELGGCHNDVLTWMKIMSDLGFDTSNRRVLVDSYTFPGKTGRPTKKEITDGMKWLAEGATSDSKLFFQYAGHGTLVKATADKDEEFDSCLCPVDYTSQGLIVDDWIFDNLVKPLPAGCSVATFCDACHSGSMCDLQYIWKWEGEEKKFAPARPAPSRTRGFHQDSSKHAEATVVAFSGCKDDQTSSDVSDSKIFKNDFAANVGKVGSGGGAMTNAMAEALSTAPKRSDGRPDISYMELLFRCQESLQRRQFKQVPQLTSSKRLDLNQKFDMANL